MDGARGAASRPRLISGAGPQAHAARGGIRRARTRDGPDEQQPVESGYQGAGAIGPGGQDIVVDDDGETWIMYHSWDPTATYRRVQIDELTWNGDTPVVDGPDRTPQPKP